MAKMRPRQRRSNWFQKQAANLTKELVKYGVKGMELKGKASEDLSRQGGWEVLMGSIAYKDASEIWNAYTKDEMLKIFGTHAVVYACVNKIVSAIQEPPLTLGRETEDGFEYADDDESDILELITKHPNSLMNYRQWVGVITSHLLLAGDSYIWEWRDKAGYLTELWPIPASWIKPNVNSEGVLVGYEIWQGKGNRVPVALADMTRIYLPDPANPVAGIAPMQAALKDYQTDVARENYIAEMLTNMKVPGLVLKQPEGWDEEQKREARSLIEDMVGKGRRGNSLFLSGEGAAVELMAPLKDLDWPGLTSLSETRICSAFGVPPQTVGLRAGEAAKTYSNYEEANRAFYNQTVVSFWLNLQSSFTKGFIQDEIREDEEEKEKYEDLEFRFDLSGVLQLQEDQMKVTERVSKQFVTGLITRNEARLDIGKEPLDPSIGDVLVMPMNLIEIPTSPEAEASMEEEQEEEPEHLQEDEEEEEEEIEEEEEEEEEPEE